MKAILTVEDIIRQAASANAYKDIHPDVIRRVCETESRKGLKSRELVKSIRSRLHQIGGAYLPGTLEPEDFSKELRSLPSDLASSELQGFCRKKMELHASTRERLPVLDRFFAEVLAGLLPIQSIMDLACGLTPLSIPWMPLKPETTYLAVDMYTNLAECLQVFANHIKHPLTPLAADVISFPFEQEVDVALVLKTLPCLEQQGKGLAANLIDHIHARHIVISYPLRTLGGNRKGMGGTYESDFNRLAEGRNWQVARFEFPNELVFRVTRG